MTGKGKSSSANLLQYPMVDLFTGGMVMPLMFMNAAATCYLLSLNAPLAFMQLWNKAFENLSSRPTRYEF